MKKLLLFIVCICCKVALSQTFYFVDGATGNDANSGTSLAKAWKTIEKACDSAKPNSIVYIKAGTYHENLVVHVSGTLGNPIEFRSYANDSVFIDGNGTGGTTMLYMREKSYLTFRNLVVQNLTVNNAQGIVVDSSSFVKTIAISFISMTVRHINWTASASTIPSSTDNAQGLIVYGGDSGLTNLVIDSCHVYSNILGFSEAVSIDGNINGFSVTNCIVRNNTNIGILAAGNYGTSRIPATDHARNGVIKFNTCYKDVSNYATSGGIYVDGGWNVTIERNISYQNGYGIEVGCEQSGSTDSIMVRDNLFYNNQAAGFAIGGYDSTTTGQVLNSTIRNNTFFQDDYSNSGTGEMYMTKASNCVIKNNIFYTNSQNTLITVDPINPQTNDKLSYDRWYTPVNDSTNVTVQWRTTSYTDFNSYRIGTGQEAGSQYENPVLVNAVLPTPDLHLKSTSPCINAGDPSTIAGSGETDYEGNTRVSGGKIDIGAYEYPAFVGIDEMSETNEFTLYPNPANDVILINNRGEKPSRICLLNELGQKMMVTNGEVIVLPVAELQPGIYFVQLQFADGKKETRSFIKK